MPTRISLTVLCLLLLSPASWAQPGQGRGGSAPIQSEGVLNDGPLPDLNAYSTEGDPIKLRELCENRYTVLVSGCLTCPKFHDRYVEIEAAQADYATLGVQFYYFYKSLRHPELDGRVEPLNINERLLHIAEAQEKLGTNVPWISDTLEDSMRISLRAGPNSVYLIAPDGEIVFAAYEIDRESLRAALTEHIGPIEQPTVADDLDLPRVSRPARQVNEDTQVRVERPTNMVILKITPTTPDQTYYVKLRAEAEPELLRTGTGRLFLGFYPDPIYDAKWNNLTPQLKYVLELPEGVSATPVEASAAAGEGDTDTEPRQFWVDIESDGRPGDITLTMHYYGCTPEMCMAMSHQYTISFVSEDRAARTYGIRGQRGERGERGERPSRDRPNRGSDRGENPE